MIGQTNSLVGGLGGTLVFAKPLPSQILHKDDKVFVKQVDFNTEQTYTATVSGTAQTHNTYIEPFFLNDMVVLCLAPDNTFSFEYIKYATGWVAAMDAFLVDNLSYALFRTHTRGNFLVLGGKYLLISDAMHVDDVTSNNCYYAGKFGNYDYAVSSLNGSVHLYHWGTKTADNAVLSQSLSYATHGADEGAGLLFVQDTNMVFYLIGYANDSFALKGYSALSGFVVAYTGLGSGDYLFTVESHGATYNKHYLSTSDTTYVAGSGTCNLKIYISDGEGGVTAIGASSPLYRFTLTPSVAHFDSRTNILFIGTTTGVYFFYWDKTDNTFTEIVIDGLELPVNPDGNHIYNAALSPNLRNLLVYCGNAGDGGRNVKIYDLVGVASADWLVVNDADIKDCSHLVWSAVATGNTDNNGNAELKIVLPAEENVSVAITPTPDSFNFLGGE